MDHQRQNVPLKTVDIKGKAYVQVHERVRIFRTDAQFKGYALLTSPIEINDEIAFFKAEVIDPSGKVVANGHAREVKSASYINKTSYIENAETSAIGRALGNLGIGIETSFATADEVLVAVANQEALARNPQEAPPTKAQLEFIERSIQKLGLPSVQAKSWMHAEAIITKIKIKLSELENQNKEGQNG